MVRETVCKKCGIEKSVYMRGDYPVYYCRPCRNVPNKLRKRFRREAWGIDLQRSYDRYWKVKDRAKKKSVPFTLTVEDFHQLYKTKICVYCDQSTDVISMDRLVPSVGYVLDNIVMACLQCNGIKNNYFTFDEMKKIGKVIGTVKKAR